jgi:hypothetical protein
MYELGKRSKPVRHTAAIAFVVLLLIVAGAGTWWGAQHYLTPDTVLQQSTAEVHTVKLSDTKEKTFEKPEFHISLPDDWKAANSLDTIHRPYSWRGTSQADRTRSLDIYVDDIPKDMAVNRLLPVQADGNSVTIVNTVSDNCAGFTSPISTTAATGSALARWSGVEFICDMANKTRDVTGTSSSTGVNSVTLKGGQGTHRYFFVYTDNSGQSDYSIFTRALASFRSK